MVLLLAACQASVNRAVFPFYLPLISGSGNESEMHMNKDMEKQLQGYGLTTAQILYRMPDHPAILQTYIWQEYDLAPDFPEMRGFLKFWQEKLDGPLHSVRYIHRKLISATEWRALRGEFVIH
jgi:uncharacterized protein Usg